METIIELDKLRKVYRMGGEKIVALDEITLNFEKNKIYCLLGKSGSGKSTLLNMLAGLERPSKGSIIFNGRRLDKLNESKLVEFRRKYIGFVFQSYNLMPTLTALENVTLPLIFKKVPKKTRERRAMEMLAAVGLADRYKHKPGEMSGGQQQRVSIARAFINQPQVIFADEPTGNLDTKTAMDMMDLITSLVRENNQTLIIVTHNLELSAYADQVINIRDGRIESIQTALRGDMEGDYLNAQ
ncbi:MAG: ABC transporter ATP-binding protein [Clostridiales bacterium]|nr:ABC transporter ATP-binding protein [Clostridiales bacterium]